MNIIELNNDNLETIGTGADQLEYYKQMIIGFISKNDFDAMESTDLREFASLFRKLYDKKEKLLKVGFTEYAMDSSYVPYVVELV